VISEETYKRVYYWKKILHGIALLITAMSMSLPTKHPKRHEKATLNIKTLSMNILLSLVQRPMKA
jgi:hypothetical protein